MQTIYGGAGAKYCNNSYNCETVMTEEQMPEKSASETRLASLPLKIGDIVLQSRPHTKPNEKTTFRQLTFKTPFPNRSQITNQLLENKK